MKIDIVAAARPNFMKIAPLWHALRQEPWANTRIIHTGQHYDRAMSDVFFEELGLPAPSVNLGIGSGSHGQQTGRVLEAFEACLLANKPDLVVVVGDVNATPAAAMAAVKLGIPTAHLEAGLRSFDRGMPEEINRLITDAICDQLWTPSEDADDHLLSEGVLPSRIHRVGNIMIDTLEMLLPAIRANDALDQYQLKEKEYALVTLHRPSNVDNAESLNMLCDCLGTCAKRLPLLFPLHPRTKAALDRFGFSQRLESLARVQLIPPQPYVSFMNLLYSSKAVITDSGGIQEETSYLGIPCLTLRNNTERPVTITQGTNKLVNIETVVAAFDSALRNEVIRPTIPLWDGKTAGRIVALLKDGNIPSTTINY